MEIGILPLLIVIEYGNTKQRKNSILYLIVFTIWFRIFMLLDLMLFKPNTYNIILWIVVIFRGITFISKLPIYGLHYWLPKAHVECITLGSCILARVILKLRINLVGMKYSIMYLIGLFLSIICLCIMSNANDFKIWVALSTIVHMTVLICGFQFININIVVYYISLHSILSPIIFYIIRMIYSNSRT